MDIVPSDSKRYLHDDVVDAIEGSFGVKARLHCDREGKLSEVDAPILIFVTLDVSHGHNLS